MDVEKEEAKAELIGLLEEIEQNGGRKSPRRRGNAVWEGIRRFVGWMFGFHPPPHHRHEEEEDDTVDSEFSDYLDNIEKEEYETPSPPPEHKSIGNVPCWKLKEAVNRIRRINKLLSSFERGFISEGGIKDREWYRHLGVAPGKWLGARLF